MAYRVSGSGRVGRQRLTTHGTAEARREDLQAERDIREGRYHTLRTIESLVHASPPAEAVEVGALKPGGAQDSFLTSGEAWTVEFYVDEKLVASRTFVDPPAEVVLREANGKYWIEALAD